MPRVAICEVRWRATNFQDEVSKSSEENGREKRCSLTGGRLITRAPQSSPRSIAVKMSIGTVILTSVLAITEDRPRTEPSIWYVRKGDLPVPCRTGSRY